MKIATVNISTFQGGASRAAARSVLAWKYLNFQSIFFYFKNSIGKNRETVQIWFRPAILIAPFVFFYEKVVPYIFSKSNRTGLSNTVFTLSFGGYNLDEVRQLKESDLIHLHWISRYISPASIRKLLKTGRPVLWTLHDEWAYTGGCHYTSGCEGFKKECDPCPQQRFDPFRLPANLLRMKKEMWGDPNLVIVTPSRWLARQASESAVFRKSRIEVVPNGIETDLFHPMDKQEAKRRAGLDPDSIILLFAAENGNEIRKGFHELLAAVRRAIAILEENRRIDLKKVQILALGKPSDEIHSLPLRVNTPGYIKDDASISLHYNASDLVILPSLEDNLPNIVLEAMSCGTPVLAFRTGGIPDMITHHKNGSLVPPRDSEALGKEMAHLIENAQFRAELGREARVTVEESFSLKAHAENLKKIAESLQIRESIKQGDKKEKREEKNREGDENPAVKVGYHSVGGGSLFLKLFIMSSLLIPLFLINKLFAKK